MDKFIVSAIWIYPVKSLGGIRLSSSRVMPKGLQYDRRWMLVDEENNFMSQRVYPQMALFKLSGVADHFVIRYAEQEIELITNTGTDPIKAIVWGDVVEVIEVSERHSNWFSQIVGMKCKLVSFPEKFSRPVDPRFAVNNDQVSLADAYPLLITGQSSLDDLNQRMKEPLPMNRFRPNIVFTGGEAFEEDGWKNFSIGNSRFAAVKPCSRCVLTTINQDTAAKGTEPLATLATYRKQNNKVLFGQNVIVLDAGIITEGDEIIVE